MKSFFEKLKNSETVGEIPVYLQIILTNLGCNTVGSFRGLKDEESIDLLIDKINETISGLNEPNAHGEMKQLVENDLKNYFTKISANFMIPWGHKNLLREVYKYCISLTEIVTVVESKQSTYFHERNTDETLKNFMKLAEKYVKQTNFLPVETTRALKIINDQDKWLIACPYCTSDIQVQVKNGTCIGTNFNKHLLLHHSQKNNQMNSATESIVIDPEDSDNDINNELNRTLENASKTKSKAVGKSTTVDNIIKSPPRKIYVQTATFSDSQHPTMLRRLIDNATKNFSGNKGNRFDSDFLQLCLYFFIRGGKSFYEFLAPNLNLPSIKTLRRNANIFHKELIEGKCYFDEFKQFLDKNEYPYSVAITEDATKITELIEYDYKNDTLIGLASPINLSTGMIEQKYFSAKTADDIRLAIMNGSIASYVYVILAQPIHPGASYYTLALYGSDNKFTYKDVVLRYRYILKELKQRNIELVCISTDGDLKYLKAQKMLQNFGSIDKINDFQIASDLYSEILTLQDPYHIENRLRSKLYDLADVMRIGDYFATVGHLYILLKSFPKSQHELNVSDLDPLDRLNYKCLGKITDQKVIGLLSKCPGTKGTIVFLRIIQSVHLAYVDSTTLAADRLIEATFVTQFLRLWLTHLIENNVSQKSFITINAYHGIEMNFVLLISLIKKRKIQYIHMMSSQNNESFFRRLRSSSGMESMVANCSMKGVLSRTHYMQLEEIIMNELSKEIIFPKLLRRDDKKMLIMEEISEERLVDLINTGLQRAIELAAELGIPCYDVDLKDLIRKVPIIEDEDINENYDNFLDAENISPAEVLETTEGEEVSKQISYFENDREITVTKAKFVLQLQSDVKKISTDVRERFVTKKSIVLKAKQNINTQFWKDKLISRGEWIVIKQETQIFIGHVINFQRIHEKSKLKRTFIHDFIDLDDIRSQNVYVMLNPLFQVIDNFMKSVTNNDVFFNSSFYKCHVHDNNVNINSLLNYIS
ncbi:hypothetical protein PVAND_010645 [Polypedilum vanderplanki]|uniref:Uncharacterized protein n=1 Tax=Polypedilum vanderplanki TaxID=319348 RepID=A0A9J6CGM0_POLVA|nr:hypothetical protein PVAND_010645 [Polypedilum vanderplanki]